MDTVGRFAAQSLGLGETASTAIAETRVSTSASAPTNDGHAGDDGLDSSVDDAVVLAFERPLFDLDERIADVRRVATENGVDVSEKLLRLERRAADLRMQTWARLNTSQLVDAARHPRRPTARDMATTWFHATFEEVADVPRPPRWAPLPVKGRLAAANRASSSVVCCVGRLDLARSGQGGGSGGGGGGGGGAPALDAVVIGRRSPAEARAAARGGASIRQRTSLALAGWLRGAGDAAAAAAAADAAWVAGAPPPEPRRSNSTSRQTDFVPLPALVYPDPAGYAKAARMLARADELRLPVVTVHDAAFPYEVLGGDADVEAASSAGSIPAPRYPSQLDTKGLRGGATTQGSSRAVTPIPQPNLYSAAAAIANAIHVSRGIGVPIVALVVGEAGAATSLLSFGVPNVVLMLENAVLRVPVGANVIARRTEDTNGKSADDEDLLRVLTAREAFEFGLVDAVVKEPLGGAHRMPTAAMEAAGQAVAMELAHLQEASPADLRAMRERRLEALADLLGERANRLIKAASALTSAETAFLEAMREASF